MAQYPEAERYAHRPSCSLSSATAVCIARVHGDTIEGRHARTGVRPLTRNRGSAARIVIVLEWEPEEWQDVRAREECDEPG